VRLGAAAPTLGFDTAVTSPLPETRFRLTGLTMVLLAAAAVLVVIAIGWFATEHVKHGLAFLGLAAVV
jgi:hypothetical protein